ncbi:chondroitinase family polysaccharide lyase [Sinomicrobium soli]|uniref:chondroitinase family polysaccharide lyase n=1 Tax=Sinomicrobium sp. N-1-3-6 TaxID=2219864 RepID=UPI001374DAEA|nr:chondroitinase family polysaccharide lyase [Sinomicrobium sp. N-1-3-6]
MMTYLFSHIPGPLLAAVLFSLYPCKNFSQEHYSPAVESFEAGNVLEFYDTSGNSRISVSETHRRFGTSSLRWEWTGESTVGTAHFRVLSHDESPLAYGHHFPASPTLAMSVYNETPQDGSITVSFEKKGAKEVWFSIPLSFKGWRRIWVPFYEMQGNTPEKGAPVAYDYFRVSSASEKGKLFFDDIIFSQYQDDRHQYPDMIVPFIKADQDLARDHWLPLISNYRRIQEMEAPPVSLATRMDLKKFEERIDQDLAIDQKYKVYIKTLREMFGALGITGNGTTVLGPPLTFKEEQEYYDETQQGARVHNDVKELGRVLKKLAGFHDRANPAEQQEIEAMFLAGTRYYLDQGWQAGANGGTRHHIGYNVKELAEAFFIMRRFLYEHQLLNEVGASLHWLFNLGMILDDESNFHVNIDYLNTQSYYHLMLIFLFEAQEKQAALLSAYSRYISITLAQQKEEWGFKADGTSWHHNGHYPAYGIGAFKTVPKVISTLARTRFRIDTRGHENFKKAFLTSRIYSQLYNWGFGNAGRHPLENNGIASLKEEFLLMAYAGNPEGNSKIDRDVAAAYLRLWGKDDVLNSSVFSGVNGIQKEDLSGYYTLPYAATAIHRRNDWAALIKGYSKYVWASEIYVDENRYGRYPANGTVELLNRQGEEGSGFRQEGWDWNRYPGATVVYLPLKELEAKMPLIMFRSDETFAGATSLEGNGIFGMILNEGKGSNADGPETKVGYPGRLKARKSVFSFGEKLICIGTDISSMDTENPVQTNIFQSYLTDTGTPLYSSAGAIKKFPYSTTLTPRQEDPSWLVDPYGNGYYILSGTPVQVKKEKQHSYHNKYSVNTGKMNPKGKGAKETEGNYASAWIDHGKAPGHASYQYIIYPFLKEEDRKHFERKIKQDDSYMIMRADSTAHIARDNTTHTTGYVVFEANRDLQNGMLKHTSAPALVMIGQKQDNILTISAVQPDLNFPEYQKGRFRNYSTPVTLTITLKGRWNTTPSGSGFIRSVVHNGNDTEITLDCIDGLPREFNVNR